MHSIYYFVNSSLSDPEKFMDPKKKMKNHFVFFSSVPETLSQIFAYDWQAFIPYTSNRCFADIRDEPFSYLPWTIASKPFFEYTSLYYWSR